MKVYKWVLSKLDVKGTYKSVCSWVESNIWLPVRNAFESYAFLVKNVGLELLNFVKTLPAIFEKILLFPGVIKEFVKNHFITSLTNRVNILVSRVNDVKTYLLTWFTKRIDNLSAKLNDVKTYLLVWFTKRVDNLSVKLNDVKSYLLNLIKDAGRLYLKLERKFADFSVYVNGLWPKQTKIIEGWISKVFKPMDNKLEVFMKEYEKMTNKHMEIGKEVLDMATMDLTRPIVINFLESSKEALLIGMNEFNKAVQDIENKKVLK